MRGFEARQGGFTAFAFVGDGIADAGVAHLFDRGGEDANLARPKFVDVDHLRLQHGQLVQTVNGVGLHHADAVAFADDAIHDADHHDHAQVGVVPAVDQHRLERGVAVALWGGQAGDDGFKHVGNAKAGLCRDFDGVRGVQTDHVFDLLLDPIRFGGGQVDLVQNRHDFVAGIQRLIDVGQGLRLDALAGVDDQQRAFNRAHRAGDFVGKVDVAGGVDQVQDVGFAILRRIFDADRVGLDGDATFAFDIHAVQQLRLHIARGDGAGHLDQTVGQGGFTVVNVGHDGEVADEVKLGHARDIAGLTRGGKGVVRLGGVRQCDAGVGLGISMG